SRKSRRPQRIRSFTFQCRSRVNTGLFVFMLLLLVLSVAVGELLVSRRLLKRPFSYQPLKIALEQYLFFEELLRNHFQMLAVVTGKCLRTRITLVDDSFYLLVDTLCSRFGVWFLEVVIRLLRIIERD